MKRKIALLLILGILFFSFSIQAQQYERATSSMLHLMKDLREIHSPNGINTLEEIELNGVKQWVQIRSKDKNNPVLLVLHGGPASPLMPISWAYQAPWEDFYTVVHWDQRGAGKNWTTSDTTQLASQIQFRTLIQDAYVLVDSLLSKLEKEKVWILGYSYGSSLGIRMASRIPGKVHGYIGVGQMAPGKPEELIYQKLLELAEVANDTLALHELKRIDPYPEAEGSPLKKTLLVRKWARKYNGGWYGKDDFNLLFSLPYLSSEYTDKEVASLDQSTPWLTRKILSAAGGGEWPTEFKVPLLFIMGKNDLHTPFTGAKKYFDQLVSPRKHFVELPWSGHVPFIEEPGKFLEAMRSFTQKVNEFD